MTDSTAYKRSEPVTNTSWQVPAVSSAVSAVQTKLRSPGDRLLQNCLRDAR